MRKIAAITGITFMQGLRTQTFRIVGLVFAALIAVAYMLRVLSIGHKAEMLISFGLTAMEVSGLLLIIFGCISAYYRERETRLQAIHLTFVSFFDHALGRLIGNCLLIGVYLALSTVVCAGILWHEEAWSWSFVYGAYSIFLKLSIMCAFCSLFSNLFTSAVFASLMTVFVDFSAEFAYFPLTLRRPLSVVPGFVSRVFYHLLPNFDKIDLKYQAAHGEIVSLWYLSGISLYSLFYMAVVFLISWKVFSRHEH
jgi:hypothetical protein